MPRLLVLLIGLAPLLVTLVSSLRNDKQTLFDTHRFSKPTKKEGKGNKCNGETNVSPQKTETFFSIFLVQHCHVQKLWLYFSKWNDWIWVCT